MSHKTVLMGHRNDFLSICPGADGEGDITNDFFCICPSVGGKRDITNNFSSICPSARGKRDITQAIPKAANQSWKFWMRSTGEMIP